MDGLVTPDIIEPSAATKLPEPLPPEPLPPGPLPPELKPPAARPPYPSPTLPTQLGAENIRFDFNQGCRVQLRPRADGTWRVRLRDLDSGNVLFESENKGALVNSSKRWFARFRVEVWSIDSAGAEPREVLRHDYDPAGHDVLTQFPIGMLSDVLAETIYATHSLGLFFDDVACDWQPTDFAAPRLACKAPPNARSGTTRMAGARSSPTSRPPATKSSASTRSRCTAPD